jgi:hypothetical protein
VTAVELDHIPDIDLEDAKEQLAECEQVLAEVIVKLAGGLQRLAREDLLHAVERLAGVAWEQRRVRQLLT